MSDNSIVNNNNVGGESGKKGFGNGNYNREARNKFLTTKVKKNSNAVRAYVNNNKKNKRFNNFPNIKFNQINISSNNGINQNILKEYNLKNENNISKNITWNGNNTFIPDKITAKKLGEKFEDMLPKLNKIAELMPNSGFETVITKWDVVKAVLKDNDGIFVKNFKEGNEEKGGPHGGFFLRKIGDYGNNPGGNAQKIKNNLAALNTNTTTNNKNLRELLNKSKTNGEIKITRIELIRYLFRVMKIFIKTAVNSKKKGLNNKRNKAKRYIRAAEELQKKLNEKKAEEGAKKVTSAVTFNSALLELVKSMRNFTQTNAYKTAAASEASNGGGAQAVPTN